MTDQPVTRSEFNSAIRHLEALLEKQTEILQQLAVTKVEARNRDEKVSALTAQVAALQKENAEIKQKLSWYAGAGAVLAGAWPIVAKKLGFM